MTTGTSTPPKKTGRDALLDRLVNDYAVFRDAKPLAIGIHKAILDRLPELTKEQVSKALRIHTASTRYLKAMAKATQRFDLDGAPAGEVTQEQRDAAGKLVKERIARANEKKKAEESARKEEERARQQQEKLQQLAAKFNSR